MSFAWSFSKLKNFENCPKRFKAVDVDHIYEDGGEALEAGNRCHTAMAARLSKGAPLPAEFALFEGWAKKVAGGSGELLVEQKYAIDPAFKPVPWRAKSAWYRGIGDVVRIAGRVALIVDWKTGKIKEDSVQLALMAQCVFSHFENVTHVKSMFVWLNDDCDTPEMFERKDMAYLWSGLMPRVSAMQEAATKQEYGMKPSGLCKWCPVEVCPKWQGKKGTQKG